MQGSLHSHIMLLEDRLQVLRNRLTNPMCDRAEREQIESEIQMATLALFHYRRAFELERETIVR